MCAEANAMPSPLASYETSWMLAKTGANAWEDDLMRQHEMNLLKHRLGHISVLLLM